MSFWLPSKRQDSRRDWYSVSGVLSSMLLWGPLLIVFVLFPAIRWLTELFQ